MNIYKNHITTVVIIFMYITLFIFIPFVGGLMYRWKKKHAILAIVVTLIAYLVNKYTIL